MKLRPRPFGADPFRQSIDSSEATLRTSVSPRGAVEGLPVESGVDKAAQNPLVSILTPSYNQVAFIADCVNSVIAQRYNQVEHVISDGGSDDGTVAYLGSLTDAKVRWSSERDEGQSHALQKAFNASSGEIVGWLNSDDAYVTPDVISRVVSKFAEHPEAGAVFGHTLLVRANGEVMQIMKASRFLLGLMPYGSSLYQPSVFVRRDVILEHGFVDRSFQLAMDYELWMRLLRRGVRFQPLGEYVAIDRHQPARKVLVAHAELQKESLRVTPGRTTWTGLLWKSAHLLLRVIGAWSIGGLYKTHLFNFLCLPSRKEMYRRQLTMARRRW